MESVRVSPVAHMSRDFAVLEECPWEEREWGCMYLLHTKVIILVAQASSIYRVVPEIDA